jgi:trans-2,3-dihydro-3-hydroxyanthranilate isomerase
MTLYPFMQIDAFTDRPLGGNPCAVIFEADSLSDETMQAIAREMNLSETAFVRKSDKANVGARYFTPESEIPLAGHPTIATMFALVYTDRLKLTGEQTTFTLELPAGVIPIEIFGAGRKIERIVMSQIKPQFLATHDPEIVLPIFNLAPEDALSDVPIQTVSTGTPQMMIPLRDHAALRRAQINLAAYNQYRAESDFFSPHLFCLGGATPAGDTFARHIDSSEDPFTGSATGGMAAYLWHYGLIDQPTFIAEQGHWMARPGQAFVEVVGEREDIETVKVGGTAAPILRGVMEL